jgi:hypothetical protein
MPTNARLTQAQEIAKQMRQLRLQLEALNLSKEEKAGLGVAASSVHVESEIQPPPKTPRRPLKSARDQVLAVLEEVGLPMLSRDIQQYSLTRYGVKIDPTRFGSLRKAEIDAYDRKSHRSVWLAYGLTDKGEAVKRLLARSDFPLSERVVGPYSGRRLFFATTARLCGIALCERDHIEDFGTYSIFVADHARDLPGITNFQKGEFAFDRWLETANAALANIIMRDLQDRKHIAMRLTMLSEKDRLFGTEFSAEDHAIAPPITTETFAR